MLVVIDEGGRVVEWGRRAEELFGWAAEDAVGQEVAAVLPEVAANDELRREDFPEFTSVLVKPVMRGSSVVWRVLAAGDALPGRDVAVLTSLFAPPPVGLHVLDDQLRVVRPGAARPGLPAGGRPFDVFEREGSEAEADAARRVLRNGRPAVNRLVQVPGEAGHRTHSVSYFRLEGGDGEVLGLVAYETDVTDREKVRGRLALLEAVHARVGHGLNLGAVCRELVEAVVPAFASGAVVEMIEDIVRGQGAPHVPVRPGVPLRRAAVSGTDPAFAGPEVGPIPAGTPFSDVLADLRPRLLAVEDGTAWLRADPVRAALVGESGAHSLIVAPLVLHGRALGLVSFSRDRHADPFEEDDLTVASGVCTHAALCLDNVSRYMREWVLAQTVQRRLLPQEAAAPTALEIAHLHQPSPSGGGAWFDVIELPGERTLLVVGDVTGQGITTAITVGLLRTAVQTLAAMDLRPDELLARLNDTATRLAAGYTPADLPEHGPLTADCTVALYDPVDRTCTVACAGLPEPLAVLPDGTSADLSVAPGPPLAGPGTAPFPAETVDLPEGSILAMGTAAVAGEAPAPSGPLRRILDSAGARPLRDLRDDIAAEIDAGQSAGQGAGEPLVLLARTRALPRDRVLTLDLPPGSEAAPIAREATRRQLDVWGAGGDTAFTAELVVSELVGNAVRHGTPPLRLRLILGQTLTCEVSDAASSAPHVQHARTVDETGRGLFILATLADQWGARYHTKGKTVWAELPAG